MNFNKRFFFNFLVCFLIAIDTHLDRSFINQTEDPVVGQKFWTNDDPFYLQNSDHPRMILVPITLTGNNYLSWSRSIKIALGAKV